MKYRERNVNLARFFLLVIWAKAARPYAALILNLPPNELTIYETLDQARLEGVLVVWVLWYTIAGALVGGWRDNTGFR